MNIYKIKASSGSWPCCQLSPKRLSSSCQNVGALKTGKQSTEKTKPKIYEYSNSDNTKHFLSSTHLVTGARAA